MSILRLNAAQVGLSLTASNNFTLYQPATPDGTLRIGNGNVGAVTDRVVLTSAGNLGLGLTPSAWTSNRTALQVGRGSLMAVPSETSYFALSANAYDDGADKYIAAGYATRYKQHNGIHSWFSAPSGTAGNAISFTQAMTLDASGNLGIGTTSPSQRLHVYKASYPILYIADSSYSSDLGIDSGSGNFVLGNNSSAATIIKTGGSERMRIDSSGNLLVGTTAQQGGVSARLVLNAPTGSVNGALTTRVDTTSATTHIFFQNPNNTVGSVSTSGSSTTFATSSDYRLKENIQPMANALAVVDQLNPVTYTWKADGSEGQGFIAHELQAVVPDCVTGTKDAVDEDGNPVYQGIDTSFLVATLTKAIQELNAKVDAQAAELAVLKGEK